MPRTIPCSHTSGLPLLYLHLYITASLQNPQRASCFFWNSSDSEWQNSFLPLQENVNILPSEKIMQNKGIILHFD